MCPGPRRHGPHGALPVGADDRPAARPDPHQTRVQSLQGDQLTNLQMIYPPCACAMHVCAFIVLSINIFDNFSGADAFE